MEFVAVKGVSKLFGPKQTLIQQLGKRFLGIPFAPRTVQAVSNVTFEIKKGEVLALVGESGCGKSTLGRVIAGIHAPSMGSAKLEGRAMMDSGRKPKKVTTRVQMVFQDPFASLDPRVQVGETIAEGPVVHGIVRKAEARAYVTRWLTKVGLPIEAFQRYPHQFSGGQRQRVAIARALAMKPDVLVCDEPVASLDVSIQAQIVNLFMDLKKDLELTILFISHDLGVVRHLADRVAVMYLGRIVEIGPTQQIYESPQHPYTQALLESVPKLTTDESQSVTFKVIDGELPSPITPPSGCHFHPRCPHAAQRCRVERPALIGQHSAVACFYPGVKAHASD